MMVVLAAESTAVPAAGWAAVPEQLHYNIGGGGIAYQQLWRHATPIVHASLGGTSLQLSCSFTDMPHHSCMPHRVTHCLQFSCSSTWVSCLETASLWCSWYWLSCW